MRELVCLALALCTAAACSRGVRPILPDLDLLRRAEARLAQARRRATSWFNTAAASFNLSRHSEARQYAERVIDDAQFGQRARDLLARLPASP